MTVTKVTIPGLPDGTGRTVLGTDLISARLGSDTGDVRVTFAQIAAAISDAAKAQVFDISGFIEGPTNKTYTILLAADFAGTINTTKTKSTSGTATATFKVNTTALGSTNSVSSAGDSVAQTTTNTFVVGDTIAVTISANSSCIDFSFTMKITRTLA